MWGFFTAYAVGLYLHAQDAGSGAVVHWLYTYVQTVKTALENVECLFSSGHAKAITITPPKNMPGTHLSEGLKRSISRMAHENEWPEVSDEAMKLLQAAIPSTVHQNQKLTFLWTPLDTLEVYDEKRLVQSIQDPRLCRYLFSIYVGASPVDKSLRSELLKTLTATQQE